MSRHCNLYRKLRRDSTDTAKNRQTPQRLCRRTVEDGLVQRQGGRQWMVRRWGGTAVDGPVVEVAAVEVAENDLEDVGLDSSSSKPAS